MNKSKFSIEFSGDDMTMGLRGDDNTFLAKQEERRKASPHPSYRQFALL